MISYLPKDKPVALDWLGRSFKTFLTFLLVTRYIESAYGYPLIFRLYVDDQL